MTGIDPAGAGAGRTQPWRPWTGASRALASWGESTAAASHPRVLALLPALAITGESTEGLASKILVAAEVSASWDLPSSGSQPRLQA